MSNVGPDDRIAAMHESEKALKGAAMLRVQGHRVEFQLRENKTGNDDVWWEVDGDLTSAQEMKHIADGVYSFAELHELFVRRCRDKGEL
jgi:hypothetical protein